MSTPKFQNRFRIPSARFEHHDYNGGLYFITICTKNREHFFGKMETNEIVLSEIGKFTSENLEQIATHYPYAEIPLFVVMPNHIHAIIVINDKPVDPVVSIEPTVPIESTGLNDSDGLNGLNGLNGSDGLNVETMCTSSLQISRINELSSINELSRINELSPINEILPINGISSINELSPINEISPINELSPINGIAEIKPNHEIPNNRWKNDTVDEKMQSISHKRGNLSVVVGGLKRAVTRFANQNNIEFAWQERFHDRIIRDQNECNRIADYIVNNPIHWLKDEYLTS